VKSSTNHGGHSGGRSRGNMKFGGYMLGGKDHEEAAELRMLDQICARL
jgi:hypothetical protein